MLPSPGAPFVVQRRRSYEEGLSLLELLIAMTLFAVVAVGILPLIMRSLSDSNRGKEATEVSHLGQSEVVPVMAAPFDSAFLNLKGDETERVSAASWVEGDPAKTGDRLEGWTDEPRNKGRVRWTRRTHVRWLSSGDLGRPLRGTAKASEVNVKEIRVQLLGQRQGGALGAGQELWLRVFKAY